MACHERHDGGGHIVEKIEAALGLRQQQTDFEVVGLHLREFLQQWHGFFKCLRLQEGFNQITQRFGLFRTHRVCLRKAVDSRFHFVRPQSPHTSVSQQVKLPLRLLFFFGLFRNRRTASEDFIENSHRKPIKKGRDGIP